MATVVQRVRASLKEQLKRKGASEYHFDRLVEDYCSLVEIKEKLQKDIDENGVTITEYNIKGFEIHKTNPAVAELTRINTAALKILDKLGINADDNIPANSEGGADDTGL